MDKLVLIAPPGSSQDEQALNDLWHDFQTHDIELHVAKKIMPLPIGEWYVEFFLIGGGILFTKLFDHYVDKILDLLDASIGPDFQGVLISLRKGQFTVETHLKRIRDGDREAILKALQDLEQQEETA